MPELPQWKPEYSVNNERINKLELLELLDFISDWIVNHITKTDSRYFREMEILM